MNSAVCKVTFGTLLLVAGLIHFPAWAAEGPADRVDQLQAELSKLREENARLKDLLAEHGIEPGKGYQSIVEILAEMPADMRAAQAWDKFAIDAVVKWLNEHPIGEPFEATLQVANVQIGRNPTAASSATIGWMVSIYPTKRDFKFGGRTFTQVVGGNWPLPLRLRGGT